MGKTSYMIEAYDDEGRGPFTHFECLRDINAAKRWAGRTAKKMGGPVDLAFDGSEPWNDRYITTASPSEYHSSGYRFERLDG